MKINTKSKNFQIILFSVIGIAVLGLVVLFLTLTAPKEEEEEEENITTTTTIDPALVMQPDEISGDVKKITIENSTGRYSISLKGEGDDAHWVIDGSDVDENLLSQSDLQSVADALTDMTARSLIEEKPADLSAYGLDKPQAKVTAEYEQGSMTLLIGGTVTSGAANYVMIEGGNAVYSYYTYLIQSFIEDDEMSFINTQAMPNYDNETQPEITKITVTRKDMEKPLIIESLPDVPEGSDSIQVYAYTFTSPTNVYLDLGTGTEFLYAIFGLTAQKAVYLEDTDETRAATGLDDPFCEVDVLAGDTIYRLYIGDAVTEEVTDEETGVTKTEIVGYYGISNKVPGVIYLFSPDDLVWVTMEINTYMSKMFLVPYIYDVDNVHYHDDETDFTVKITGNNEENAMYMDGEEVDAERFRSFYQFLVSCRGEELYTDEERGDFIAEFTYTYEDEREPDTVSFYYAPDGERSIIIAINDVNVFTTKWNYQVRLRENAKAFLDGGDIVDNY